MQGALLRSCRASAFPPLTELMVLVMDLVFFCCFLFFVVRDVSSGVPL